MAYYVGDIPAEDIVIQPARNGEPIDLSVFNEATVALHGPDGAVIPTIGFMTDLDTDDENDQRVVIEWPGTTVFAEPGRYALIVTLITWGGTIRERLAPVVVVVQAEDGWHNIDSARADWDAGTSAPASDDKLFELLELAREDCLEYAPVLAEGAPIPLRYRAAQLQQAKNTWDNSKPTTSPGTEGELFAIKPFPLDWHVKNMLRPKRGTPVV